MMRLIDSATTRIQDGLRSASAHARAFAARLPPLSEMWPWGLRLILAVAALVVLAGHARLPAIQGAILEVRQPVFNGRFRIGLGTAGRHNPYCQACHECHAHHPSMTPRVTAPGSVIGFDSEAQMPGGDAEGKRIRAARRQP